MDYNKRICQAMNFIARNLDRDLSLEEIAGAANFSMFHFHRIFKAVVGETVGGFTKRIRLEMAANRLISKVDNPLPITQIALDFGFSSSQNFAKAFRKQFNTSPSEFRKSKIGNNKSNVRNALSVKPVYDPVRLLEKRQKNTNQPAVFIKDIPEYHVAYIRKMGNYDTPTHDAAFADLMPWAIPRGYCKRGKFFGVYWDNPEVTPKNKCRIDACISIPKDTDTTDAIGMQVIGGGCHAVCSVKIVNEEFKTSWDDLFEWIVTHGYVCDDRPNFQHYKNDGHSDPEGAWYMDLYVPLSTV